MFKRVRLNVLQQSRGRQITWKSTSLEDDFYFNDGKIVPPVQVSTTELVRTFAVEKQDWAEIIASKNAADFFAFLVKYPNGFLAEQARFRLDQLGGIKKNRCGGKDPVLAHGLYQHATGWFALR